MLTISSVAVSPLPPQAPTVARVQPATPTKGSNNVSLENQGVVAPVTPAGEGSRAQLVYAPSSLPPVNPTGDAPRVNNFNNPAVPERTGDGVAQSIASQLAARRADTPVSEPPTSPDADGTDSSATADARPSDGGAPSARDVSQDRQTPPAEQAALARAEQQRFRGELPVEVKNPAMEAMDTQIKELLPNMWKASRAAVDVLIGEEARAAAARAEVLGGRPPVPPERAVEATENYSRTSNLPDPGSAGRNVDRLV